MLARQTDSTIESRTESRQSIKANRQSTSTNRRVRDLHQDCLEVGFQMFRPAIVVNKRDVSLVTFRWWRFESKLFFRSVKQARPASYVSDVDGTVGVVFTHQFPGASKDWCYTIYSTFVASKDWRWHDRGWDILFLSTTRIIWQSCPSTKHPTPTRPNQQVPLLMLMDCENTSLCSSGCLASLGNSWCDCEHWFIGWNGNEVDAGVWWYGSITSFREFGFASSKPGFGSWKTNVTNKQTGSHL